MTQLQSDGKREIIESQLTKIIRVPPFRGAMTYYGFAQCGGWSTLEWLRQRATEANNFGCPEDFAHDLADKLNSKLNSIAFSNPLDRVLGVHFTAYERISDYWIPEFFHIRNWDEPLYSSLLPGGFAVSRETYATLKELTDRPADQREVLFRMAVHETLQSGVVFRFNNGDPVLFNPIANALFNIVQQLTQRGHIRQPTDVRMHLALARRPIEVVSKLLADVSVSVSRVIGGKLHDLGIAPDGTMESTTGD